MGKTLRLKCSYCRKEFDYYLSKYRPFCCEKCKLSDLGTWLAGGYSIAGRDNSVFIEDVEKLQKLIELGDENY